MTYYTVEVNGRNVRVESQANGTCIADVDIRFCPHTEVLADAVNFFESLWDKTFGNSDWIAEIETPLQEWLLDESGLEFTDELWQVWDRETQPIEEDEVLQLLELYNCETPNDLYVDACYDICREGVACELEKIWFGNLEREAIRDDYGDFQRGIKDYAIEKITGFSSQNMQIRNYILQLAEVLLDKEFRAESKDYAKERAERGKCEKV